MPRLIAARSEVVLPRFPVTDLPRELLRRQCPAGMPASVTASPKGSWSARAVVTPLALKTMRIEPRAS
jgi:hypothetical protein